MNATVTLESPHRSHLRTRVFATAAALAMVAGGTAFIVAATTDDTAPKPAIVVHATRPADPHHDRSINRAQRQAILDDQLTTHNGRR